MESYTKMMEDKIFELGYDDLGYYLPNGKYTLEKGEIEIYVGCDCLASGKTVITVV